MLARVPIQAWTKPRRRRDLTAATERTREYARIFGPATSESGDSGHPRPCEYQRDFAGLATPASATTALRLRLPVLPEQTRFSHCCRHYDRFGARWPDPLSKPNKPAEPSRLAATHPGTRSTLENSDDCAGLSVGGAYAPYDSVEETRDDSLDWGHPAKTASRPPLE